MYVVSPSETNLVEGGSRNGRWTPDGEQVPDGRGLHPEDLGGSGPGQGQRLV